MIVVIASPAQPGVAIRGPGGSQTRPQTHNQKEEYYVN